MIMEAGKTKLICVKDPDIGGYTVWPEAMPGMVIEVEDLKDAPREMAKLYRVVLEHGFKEGEYTIIESL